MPLRIEGMYCLTKSAVLASATSKVIPICAKRSPPGSARLTTIFSMGRNVGGVLAVSLAATGSSTSSSFGWARLDNNQAAAPPATTSKATTTMMMIIIFLLLGFSLAGAAGALADTGRFLAVWGEPTMHVETMAGYSLKLSDDQATDNSQNKSPNTWLYDASSANGTPF